jgi:hypothetical protein
MISCTEFIPAYSTLFTYLEENWGAEEVPVYWSQNFDPAKAPIYGYIRREGIRGCFSYWTVTLNEEAADFTMYLNEKRGFYLLEMHRCPSKGRLLELKDTVGVEPYRNYCFHCDHYRASVEACGLCYIYNFSGIHKAACSILIYDPKIFDGRVIIDADTLVMDRRAGDNEYFHCSFHHGLNAGMEYLRVNYGDDHVRRYLERFSDTVYRKVAQDAKVRGLAAIREKILDTYAREHALDAVETELTEEGLSVKVHYCPALRFMRSEGAAISPLYRLSTETVMEVLAKNAGFGFTMDAYDPETGAASYRFTYI